tara:strand:- start:46 stop:177 length:132 start_codon:yes stop_codon:yes gene_type:complete
MPKMGGIYSGRQQNNPHRKDEAKEFRGEIFSKLRLLSAKNRGQ